MAVQQQSAEILYNVYSNYINSIASQLGINAVLVPYILSVIIIWTLVWKGLALWKSAKKNNIIWFIILLVLNDFGILEIIYFFWLSKIRFDSKTKKAKKK